MESTLLRYCNTVTVTRALCIPCPFHGAAAANLQFSFRRRHSSLLCGGKSSRSYQTREILGPIINCEAGGGGLRTSSKEKNKGGNEEMKMAKRLERASFALACVVGVMISYSFWLKQQVIALAAPPPQMKMESIPRVRISRKPCPHTKANPHCKCRRVAIKPGSESNGNQNLQKPCSEIAGDEPENLQNPNSEVAGDKEENLQNPNSEVPGGNLQKPNPEEVLSDLNENLQKPNSEVPGGNLQKPNPEEVLSDLNENLQKPNSEVPGDVNENLQKPNSEVLSDLNENFQKSNSELPGDVNENLQKPNSEDPASVPQVLDKSEDSSQSKSVPQQTSSPSHGGELGSLVTAISIGGLISEVEKRLKGEFPGTTSNEKVDDHSSQSQSQSLPPQESLTVSKESLISADMAEKHLKSEAQEKTSNVKPAVKAEELPQSPSLPQQAPPTVWQKASLTAVDMAYDHLKHPESQERKQVPITVSQESILPEDTGDQGNNSDVKVNSITTAAHSSPLLPSPLVSISFKVDSSAMPSLAFVSPSTTTTPAEPRQLGRSKSDKEDGSKVLVRGVPVSSSAASVAEQIFADHGDITANCLLKDQAFRANLVEGLVTVMQVLQEFPARKLTNDDLILMQRKLEDLEKVNVDVGWLREQIEAVGPFLDLVESRKKWEAVAAEVGKLGAKVAEQEEKLAQHEGALAQKLAEKAKVETQEEQVQPQEFAEVEIQVEVESEGSAHDNLRKEEDKPLHAWTFGDLGVLLHAFGFGSLFYLFFMPK